MNLTKYQAKYFAYELDKRSKSDSTDKFGAALLDAKVDLNPHQVEAALFAFNSPLSKGAILADEVGLGKTIEAGIVLSQFWATGKRKILIIAPSSLRKQWSNELMDKFYIPSVILESKKFKELSSKGIRNPFEDNRNIQICSYHFARNKEDYVSFVDWDLVVIDEAHYLRNVYKNTNKIAKSIKRATQTSKKMLLTATPLQNRLEELYGLVSFIDENIFGNLKSFRRNFIREEAIDELKERLEPVCHRTLRRQVQEYINYKSRLPITQTFIPSEKEQELYKKIIDFLHKDYLYAIPNAQKHLIISVILKLLASSSFALVQTFDKLIIRLKGLLSKNEKNSEIIDLDDELEDFYELCEEYEDLDLRDDLEESQEKLTYDQIEEIKQELVELESIKSLAQSIEHNEKGNNLLIALERGFAKLKELGANQKAVIFTESRRTQEYLFKLLNQGNYKAKVLLFNGTNSEEITTHVYNEWKNVGKNINKQTGNRSVDIRNAIVDSFKKPEYNILIATEAAAEGINLQFCSMVVNYDLPWNPQRIEQRIGRCHRYGQQFDVVVINFLDQSNEIDTRVYQLLSEKFKLFEGVFGSSDQVLGAVEGGIDFEKRLIEIYQKCRTKEEIESSFNKLQEELDVQIKESLQNTQAKLFENFDGQVIQRLKTTLSNTAAYLSKYEEWLWLLTTYFLRDYAILHECDKSFYLEKPFEGIGGRVLYTLDKKREDAIHYRINGELAQKIITKAKGICLDDEECIKFNYSASNIRYNELENLQSKRGILNLKLVSISSKVESIDVLLFSALTECQESLSSDLCQFLLRLSAQSVPASISKEHREQILHLSEKIKKKKLENIERSNVQLLQHETIKFQKWSEDKISTLKEELDRIKDKIRSLNWELKTKPGLSAEELLSYQKELRKYERLKRSLRIEMFNKEDEIEEERDALIDQTIEKLQTTVKEENIFTVSWEII